MLQQLRVKNLAIVDNARVDFTRGLNVITGETGAGKSVLMGALGLVLGERADKTMIRAGEEKCGVEAIFELADTSDIDAILEDIGLEPCEDGHLIIRRIVAAAGGSKNLVNDCPTTVQALKRIGDLLVDIHGPHDHQSLLSQDFQLDILDSYGHLWKCRDAYEEAYRAWLELESRRRELDGDDETTAQRVEMLRFQVDEIEDADLTPGIEEDLGREHATVANAQRIIELGGAAQQALTENDQSAFDSMVFSKNALTEMVGIFDDAEEWQKEAESIVIQVQALADGIASRVQNLDTDPERLQWLEDRMALIAKLKRKYGGSVEEVLAFLDKARAELLDLETREEQLERLQTQIAEARKGVDKLAADLTKRRTKAAKSLATAVTEQIRGLGFEHGVIDVPLEQVEPRPTGGDVVDLGFAPNPGEPMRPLRAIASSGEISRVMLAIKTVLAKHDKIPVLVFDEVDANVGGEMGNAVGQRLGTVAETHQVVCITHLPQVAVHGATHFVVRKGVQKGRTLTDIKRLSEDERAEEVARMLGGKDLTSVTLRHAREMLKARG